MFELTRFLEGINVKNDIAWKELYRHYYSALCNYISKMIEDPNAAEDIVQNCFIHLWDSSLHFSDIKMLTAYMYRTAYHGALNYIRDKKSSGIIHDRWMKMISEEDGVSYAIEEEVISRFYTAVYELTEQQREILLLSLKGEKVKDIAFKLSISENTVKTQKKRAYLYIRKRLDHRFELVLTLLFS